MPSLENNSESRQDVQPLRDQRNKVPELIPYLLPGEMVIDVERPMVVEPVHFPSAVKAILRLTNSPRIEEIGNHGPSVAANANPENKGLEALSKYEVLFGRDSLRVALDLSDYYPELLKATIIELAKLQGTRDHIHSEEEPGRIVHEARSPDDPIAQKISQTEGWEWPYYGSVDATPMFISAVTKYIKQQGTTFLDETFINKDGDTKNVGQALQEALGWVDKRLASNPEGLLESKVRYGIENQVWKDSWDSYMHADGTLADPELGIASVEVQALTYDALLDAADLYGEIGKKDETKRYQSLAGNIKEQVMQHFWIEDETGGYFALGTDRDEQGNIRPLAVRTSNMGHVLNSRLLEDSSEKSRHMVQETIKTLFLPEMLNASGIRTLASNEVRFRPGAYHNGNVWLWDTAYIAKGLERHGFFALGHELKRRTWQVMHDTKRFPEFAHGGSEPIPTLNHLIVDLWDEKQQRPNRIEQIPQEIQAWSVAAILAIKYQNEPFVKMDINSDGLERAILDKIAKS